MSSRRDTSVFTTTSRWSVTLEVAQRGVLAIGRRTRCSGLLPGHQGANVWLHVVDRPILRPLGLVIADQDDARVGQLLGL